MAITADIETPQGLSINGAYVLIYLVEIKKQDAVYGTETNPKTKKQKKTMIRPSGYVLEYISMVFSNKEMRKESRNNQISAMRQRKVAKKPWNGKGSPFAAAYADLKSNPIFKKVTDC